MPRVLIVDDKLENLYLLAALFRGHGYVVDQAFHGAQALDVARANPPDLVVSDILMPVMDGFALCRLWKQDPRLSRIPFVFYTATYTDPRERDLALGLGADHYIVKPAEPDEFMRQIEAVLERCCAGWGPQQGDTLGEERYLAQHNDALVRKLDRKVCQLAEANRYRDEFASTMSHELRTPLNVILGYVEILADETIDVRSRRDVHLRALAAGRDLLALIERTLEVSAIEAGRAGPRLERISLRAGWAALHETCAALPRPNGVALLWDDDVPDVVLETDRHMFEVVVRNLVSNACKFTERGQVRVSACCAVAELHVDVADTGVGIAPEHRDAVFEMFRQLDTTHTRRHGGVGLGLYIVRRFVEQLGGEVALESTPGRGSRFRVTIPLTAPAEAPAGDAPATTPPR